MKKRMLLYIVIFQIILIGSISYNISKKKAVLGSVSVNPIFREGITIDNGNESNLKYFYQPKPNITQTITLSYKNTGGPDFPEYKINADGFNQLSDYSTGKPKGVFRIVTLGDSFTFGQNVNTQDNYPSQLQRILDSACGVSKFQVLNLGVGGYDILYAVERFRIKGQKYDPDLVLWFLIEGDLIRLGELLFPLANSIRLSMEEAGDVRLKSSPDARAWFRALGEIHNQLGEDKILNLQSEFLRGLNNYFKKQLVITAFPFKSGKKREVLEEFASSRSDTLFYDGITDIYHDQKLFLPDNHPTPAGYAVMVDNMFNYLVENKLIPCQK